MKVNIWIKKEDVLSGNITEYYADNPFEVGELHPRLEYIQVSISVDELARLEDMKEYFDKDPLSHDAKPDPRIFERNPSTGDIRSRNSGDYGNENLVIKESDIGLFVEFPECKNLKLGDWQNWYDNLSKDDKEKYSNLQQNAQENKRKK